MSLIATRVQNWRMLNPDFDKNMTRPAEYGALDFFAEQTNSANSIITPELKRRALASMGSTIQIPVINYDADVTVSNVRSCTIADNENTSALYTIVFATVAAGFTMTPSMYMNNEIDYNHDWRRKIEKVTKALADDLDKQAIAALEANKTQVFRNPLTYPITGNTVDVPWDYRTEILGDLNPMMRANNYRGRIHIIGNFGVDAMVRKLAQHDLYNDVNKRMEYADKVFHFTNNIVDESGDYATLFAVEDGNVAVVTRVDRAAARGAKANDHEWGITTLPFIDLPFGYHYYTSVGDQSAIGGASTADMICDVKEHFGFSVDVAFIVAYNSDPEVVPNPIIKAEIGSSLLPNALARPVRIVNDEDNPIYTSDVSGGGGV